LFHSEKIGDQLDVRVLDAVVDHLHVMARTAGADVGAARFAVHVGADLRQHGFHLRVRVAGAARHDARSEQGAFLPAGDAGADKAQPACFQRRTATNGVQEIGVAAVDQDVASLQMWREVIDGLIDRRSGLDHHQDPARLVELPHQFLRRVRRCEPALRAVLLHEVVDARGGPVIDGDAKPVSGEVAGEIHAHRRQPRHRDDAHCPTLLARRRLIPSMVTTVRGMSHQARM